VLFDSIVLLRTRYWFGMDIGMACSDFRILRRYTNTNAYSYPNTYPNTNTNTDSYPNTNTDSYTNPNANTNTDSYSTWFAHVCRLRQLMEHQYR
jgi:hypothetical protein